MMTVMVTLEDIRMDGSVRSYNNSTQGTINYSTGLVEVNSLNVSNIENIRGADFYGYRSYG